MLHLALLLAKTAGAPWTGPWRRGQSLTSYVLAVHDLEKSATCYREGRGFSTARDGGQQRTRDRVGHVRQGGALAPIDVLRARIRSELQV